MHSTYYYHDDNAVVVALARSPIVVVEFLGGLSPNGQLLEPGSAKQCICFGRVVDIRMSLSTFRSTVGPIEQGRHQRYRDAVELHSELNAVRSHSYSIRQFSDRHRSEVLLLLLVRSKTLLWGLYHCIQKTKRG
jgi:hypothetical protein